VSSGGGWGTTYTGSGSNRNGGSGNPRPATASRVNTSSSKNASSGTPGTRPSTAYGLRTGTSSAKLGSGKRGDRGESNPHDQHVVAGARGMMRYRRTRAATDGQVGEGGHAWSSSSNQLPSSGSRGLLGRKEGQGSGSGSGAWNSDRPGTTGTRGTGGYGSKYDRVGSSKRQQSSRR